MCNLHGWQHAHFTAAKEMEFELSDLLIIYRASIDYAWLYGLHRQGFWFVTRLKTNACYEVVEDIGITAPDLVLADKVIRFTSDHSQRIRDYAAGLAIAAQKWFLGPLRPDKIPKVSVLEA